MSVTYRYEEVGKHVTRDSFEAGDAAGVWRFSLLLPDISPANRITLGEGQTRLTRCIMLQKDLGLQRLWAKLDSLNPSGSFKDRGSAVGVSLALERGFRSVGCTSSGNMAASVAAYGAKAGLRSLIFVPPHTPREKLIQASTYGAEVVGTGSMSSEERYQLTHELGQKRRIFMINNNSPLRIEGQKTFAFEVWRDLGFAVADWVVIPTSSGGNAYAIAKGFRELRLLGLTDRMPKILLAQSSGCAPFVKAFKEGRRNVSKWPNPDSIASAILNPNPPSGERLLKVLADTGGSAEMASDREIAAATREFAVKEGIFCEPSSATSLVALRKSISEGTISTDESVILDITGIGFKDLRVASEFYKPPEDFGTWIARSITSL